MVKPREEDSSDNRKNQGEAGCPSRASKIGPATAYGLCSERLSPFGGLLGLVKFMDLVKFKEIFDGFYNPPVRTPALGHYNMVYGLLLLLFIGFNRVGHFIYIQLDAMLCSIFNVCKLSDASTWWRYVDSLGINQGKSLLRVMSALRERVWHLCEIRHATIHIDIDATVATIYGGQQGGRKGHNTQHRGKKGYRPVLCFIAETREYFAGKLRVGETIGGEEAATLIRNLKNYLPGCVTRVILRGDGELLSGESVTAAVAEGYQFIFGNKSCAPEFDPAQWYKAKKNDTVEYNECLYQPTGWPFACRFVAMRIPREESGGPVQLELLDEDRYKHRVFATNLTQKAHQAIAEYDKRADAENLIGEAKREGLAAIPSSKFASNYAYFQIVMLAYNIWRSFKMLATHGLLEQKRPGRESKVRTKCSSREIMDNTIRIARLKLLYLAAKITDHANKNEVRYSQHDSRTAGFFGFLEYMDKRRKQRSPWLDSGRWLCKHLSALNIKPAYA
ncbi:MAG: IS1380 family transposase [Ignavibacteriales bacterium]|nr:IS1380 family transposase [Ignavibacteriales bacterium]